MSNKLIKSKKTEKKKTRIGFIFTLICVAIVCLMLIFSVKTSVTTPRIDPDNMIIPETLAFSYDTETGEIKVDEVKEERGYGPFN